MNSAQLDPVTEAGSYLRLIDFCITQLKAQGPSRICNESKEEEEEAFSQAWFPLLLAQRASDWRATREHFRSFNDLYLRPSPLSGPSFLQRSKFPREWMLHATFNNPHRPSTSFNARERQQVTSPSTDDADPRVGFRTSFISSPLWTP